MQGRPERAAQQLLKAIGSSVPVDVYEVAQHLGIEVYDQELEDSVSGMLVIEDDHAIIGVNAAHPAHRKRFTIAHEIAHFILHRSASSVFIDGSSVFYRDESSSEGSRAQEIEANAFAAELLMPAGVIKARLNNQPVDVFDDLLLHQLATEYHVSAQALTIRLTRLGLLTM